MDKNRCVYVNLCNLSHVCHWLFLHFHSFPLLLDSLSPFLPVSLCVCFFFLFTLLAWNSGGIQAVFQSDCRVSSSICLSLPSVHLYLNLYCCSLFKGFICVCVISTELEVFFSECLTFEDMNLSHKHGYISCISGVLTAHLSIGGVT